jgi:hypothetical protein
MTLGIAVIGAGMAADGRRSPRRHRNHGNEVILVLTKPKSRQHVIGDRL